MEKIYCGNGRIVSTQYGQMPKISMSKEDINKIVSYLKANNLDWVNMDFKEKQNKAEGKPTHYLQIDTWKAAENNGVAYEEFGGTGLPPVPPLPDDDDSLPF